MWGNGEFMMSRLAVFCVCVAVLNAISGCACCSCCQSKSSCGPCDGAYGIGAEYPMDFGYEVGETNCGCGGGDFMMDGYGASSAHHSVTDGAAFAEYQPHHGAARMSQSGLASASQYRNMGNSGRIVQQPYRKNAYPIQSTSYRGNVQPASMSTWDTTPAIGIAPQSLQQPAPCNCGK